MNALAVGPLTLIACLIAFLVGLVAHQNKQIKAMTNEIIILKEECIGVPGHDGAR